MSPYEKRYVDVRFTDEIPGSVTVALEEGLFLYIINRGINFVFYLLSSFPLFIIKFFYRLYTHAIIYFRRFSAMAPSVSCTGICTIVVGSHC